MCFYYLLLGHLLGDFVLQTDRIAENKVKLLRWNAVHALIVTLCMLIFSMPFGSSVVLFVLLAGVLHYVVDFYKPKIAEIYPMPGLVYFTLDQGIHVLIIYAISLYAIENTKYMIFDMDTIKLLLVAGFISSFSAILNQYVLIMFFKLSGRKFFEDSEKSMGIITRMAIVIGLYLSLFFTPLFLISVLLVVIMILLYYKYGSWQSWMDTKYFTAKLLTDIMISFICLGFVLYL